MSCCEGSSGGIKRFPGTGCCGSSCAAGKSGCLASEPRIRSCYCQENVGCIDRADCGGFRPRGTAATGACPGPCQCAEEEAWNCNVPPKPNCEWLTNFSELRRQWSDHGRKNNCKCCNCKPCRTAAPCRPCLTPPLTCSITNFARDDYKCRNDRLAGGACTDEIGQSRRSSSRQRERVAGGGGCQVPSNCAHPTSPSCPPTPSSNMYSCSSPPCSSPSESSMQAPWPACRPPSSCQPCSPSPRAILKKRSCCQCITGYCMCQPMPRTCNCPPPVTVDARAERECSCDCPSSPECACPPSERRFPRSKVKCPNARLCCPTPRPQPGPKCNCTKCQPCLPPPCDPCTSKKCRTDVPKFKPCCGDSACEENAPCRTSSPQPSPTCRPTPPCTECRKMAPPCRLPGQPCSPANPTSGSRPGSGRVRLPNRSPSPGKCYQPVDEGFGDDDEEADSGCRGAQCHCGPSGSRGCHDECDFCCSLNCHEISYNEKRALRDQVINATDNDQSKCGKSAGCAEESDYCCSVDCDRENGSAVFAVEKKFTDSNNHCSPNRDFEKSKSCESGSVGGIHCSSDPKTEDSRSINDSSCRSETQVTLETSAFPKIPVSSLSLGRSNSRWFKWPLASTPEVPHSEGLSRFSSCCVTNVQPHDERKLKNGVKKEKIKVGSCANTTCVPLLTRKPSSALKLLRSLISGKSYLKYLDK